MKFVFFFTATLFLLLSSSKAFACSCAYSDPPVAYNQAAAIFIGKMIGGTEKHSIPEKGGKPHIIESGKVSFEVSEIFKGHPEKTMTVQIDSMKGTSCGTYGLVRGVDYVVYAYADQRVPSALFTGVCTRTARVDGHNTKDDLQFLRKLPAKGSGGTIRGRIWLDTKVTYGGAAVPMPNITVAIVGKTNGKVHEVITDNKGAFEVKGLTAGTYKVQPDIPKNYFIRDRSDEITVADLGTADTGFEVYHDSNVTGRIVDKDGRLYNGAFLHLVGSDKRIYGHSTREKGVFEVKGIPPGEYVLYLELHHADYKKNRKYYYPGTYKLEEATKIDIGLGQKFQGGDFVLPPEFSMRAISGRVFWKDGKPAGDVEVLLLCPQSVTKEGFAVEGSPTRVRSDANGNFQFEGFLGTEYWLEARGEMPFTKKEIKHLHSPSNKVVLKSEIKDLRIILSENGFSGSGCR